MKLLTQDEYEALTQGPQNEEQLTAAALALVKRAEALGLVLTIEQKPLQPLAMGHHYTLVSARKSRGTA